MTAPEVKLFEVHDEMTFIPVIAVRPAIDPSVEEAYLWSRAGYGRHVNAQRGYVLLAPLGGGSKYILTSDTNGHSSSRTLRVAHAYIQQHWDDLPSGTVVDVEYIVGERAASTLSERITAAAHPP